ncbi:hypothetical protein [Rhodococcus koreensis]|uniref:hypothetical protein n=1 Tax=Rhodococcus koreensis TaxID=99653 RepID=UPI00197CF1F3|nr:hypothetical protein [Rhodococcus koreensis]QSE86073.1 hypothetical protein JWS14_44300 [Rhodococcus koreensis]
MLYETIAAPLADPQVPGGFYQSWQLMSIDGLTLDVPDAEANVEYFGRPPFSRGGGRGGAFPQVRVLGLAECGSHAIVDAALGTYTQGKRTLTESIVRSGMLLLADRGFFRYRLWQMCADTAADLLWRMRPGGASCRNALSGGIFRIRRVPGNEGAPQPHRRHRRPSDRVHPRRDGAKTASPYPRASRRRTGC